MVGKIIKGVAGFYYIHRQGYGVYECKAKGAFRNQKMKPLVGDNVEFDIIDEENKKGNVTKILPRMNELIRPAVSNVDQALVIFAITQPAPNLNLLDRFLIMMTKQEVDAIVCFNKMDIASEHELYLLGETYKKCGYQVIFTSVLQKSGIGQIEQLLKGKTTVLAGPSGVGKSSIINEVLPGANMETGSISEKIKRGKHTTRHSELFHGGDSTYIMDTPGFSSLFVNNFDKDELKNYFLEFAEYEEQCRFQGCVHINEPDCAVKEALQSGKISTIRYENYTLLYNELKNQRRY
ncbi:ribosome biogenesis GTPase [Mobilisporobacter senegalensis]|uniref:Small ribosomal subunit biogenesis GTPase RsgA n=1 Tax=Mobilisporobacter senegalensis TaxID=1329262 RepID=A0A3N1XVT9_9FIRM|nr:ribosome small subunit-dependent GTPase A [Mobilisporobacter senegalensis]ROR30729.1 ribosome biogenesis GTPase [Mobilisporobacter senegalensis]